jgi:putative polyhydroxyalkanoate system protein
MGAPSAGLRRQRTVRYFGPIASLRELLVGRRLAKYASWRARRMRQRGTFEALALRPRSPYQREHGSMPDIRIVRIHSLSLIRARAAAQAAADDLAQRYDLTIVWQGDTLHFRRSGVQGRIEVSHSQIALELNLGLLLKGFRGSIEQSIGKHLDALLDQA